MVGKWKTIRLKDVCTKIGSGSTPRGGKEAYKGGATTLIRSQNVYNEGFHRDGLVHIDDKQAAELSNVDIRSGDVLLNITGDSVARCCQVADDVLPARVNQHVAIIRPNDKELDARFLRYVLVSQPFQSHLLSLASAGATRNALTKVMIEGLEVPHPPLAEQKRIAHILGALDDKIELNRRMNKTQEEMTRALFKSWFVDFDPVRAKAEGRKPEGIDAETAKLFPDSFEDSELGSIPKGWRIGKLADFLDIKYGKDHKKLPDGKIPVYGSGGIMRYVTKAICSAESVLIPRKGTLNNIMYINKPFWTVDTMFYSLEKHPCIAKFIYLWMKRMNMELLDNGSVIPSMTTEILNNLPVITPSKQILKQFDKGISLFFAQTEQNELESCTLATLRDTLLPRMMRENIVE